LANTRRLEQLQQRLSGAQLGLSEIGGDRASQQQAHQFAQSQQQNQFMSQLAALQGGDPTNALLSATQNQANFGLNQRGQAFNEFQAGEAGRFGAFNAEQSAIRDRLDRQTQQAGSENQFNLQSAQLGQGNQQQDFENQLQLDQLKRLLEEQEKKKSGKGGGLQIPQQFGNTPIKFGGVG